MSNSIRTSLAIWLVALLIAGTTFRVFANEPQLDERTYNQIMAALSLAEEDQIPEAIESLQTLADRLENRAFPHAVVLQQLAAFQINEERYEVGLNNLRRALAYTDELPDRLTASIRYMTAQVLLIDEHFEQSLEQLQQWRLVAEQPLKPHGIFLIAYVHFQLEQFAETAQNLELIIDLPDREDRWVELLFYSYLQDGQQEQAKRVLVEALEIDPGNQNWWKYLSNILLQQEEYGSGLAGLSYARQIDNLSKPEQLEVTRLYAYLEAPEKASRDFEQQLAQDAVDGDIDNIIMLGTFWAMAREHEQAERVLLQAAELTELSQPLRLLGQIHLNRLEFEKAQTVLTEALNRATPEEYAQLHYFTGIAAYNNEQLDQAEQSFRIAAEDEDYSDRAESWLERVANERIQITPPSASD
ncbi:MAG: hypothetical protein AAF446_02655 [Pseudomonadota bacterium]